MTIKKSIVSPKGFLLTIILGGLTGLSAHPALGKTFIVKDGQPQADIVIADNPLRAVRLAAAELQTYIESITGARLKPIADK